MTEHFDFFRANIDNVYNFVVLCKTYDLIAREYDESGLAITRVEAHTLDYIDQNPGINITTMANESIRSKGAVSQIVNKLEKKGLIYREFDIDNKKIVRLYATAEGQALSLGHREHDKKAYIALYRELLANCSPADIDSFFKVISNYSKSFENGVLSVNKE